MRLEVPLDESRHAAWIPHSDFAYGRLLLPKPRGRPLARPDGTDPYYRRREGWVAAAQKAHEDGECGWSRKRRVLELEAELMYDDAPEADALYADDDAWAARRKRHVALWQAIIAYTHPEHAEAGSRALFRPSGAPG